MKDLKLPSPVEVLCSQHSQLRAELAVTRAQLRQTHDRASDLAQQCAALTHQRDEAIRERDEARADLKRERGLAQSALFEVRS